MNKDLKQGSGVKSGISPADGKPKLSAVSSDATHYLKCKHCIGTSCSYYNMLCIPLGKTKSGKLKVLVFGERNWKDKEHIKRIRYVDEYRVVPK